MEKRTIGKFIAVLRKANGMTQKELGERLFVSDKTVSRWEQDESTPELALIPVIAEIFGITTDELLRGERNSPEMREEYTAVEELPHIKTLKKKQFANMLHKHTVKFRNM
ncbi:MAG: helix-turn-helix transcriptional regulator, partial [Clostridia bacterium]|nr:helix-turn-helix transcriptional regulator [Clostridia bacterium]